MKAAESTVNPADERDIWSATILYHDAAARERAVLVCDHLVRAFLREIEFQFHWWRTDFLEDAGMAAAAADDAARAEFLIVSCPPAFESTPAVRFWLEECAVRRAGREGALIDLTGGNLAPTPATERTRGYLRGFARRATMDYLAQFPRGRFLSGFESMMAPALQAVRLPTALEDAQHPLPPPSHFGLNE